MSHTDMHAHKHRHHQSKFTCFSSFQPTGVWKTVWIQTWEQDRDYHPLYLFVSKSAICNAAVWHPRNCGIEGHPLATICGFMAWVAGISTALMAAGGCLLTAHLPCEDVSLPVSLVTRVYFYLTDTWKVIAMMALHCSDKCASASNASATSAFFQVVSLHWVHNLLQTPLNIALPPMPQNNRFLCLYIFRHWSFRNRSQAHQNGLNLILICVKHLSGCFNSYSLYSVQMLLWLVILFGFFFSRLHRWTQ